MMTQDTQPAFNQTQKIRRPFFYRDKRVLLSFLISLPVAYFFGFFPAFFIHLQVGVLVDWWFFQFKNVKESDVPSQGWLDRVGISREDLETHSTIFMWQRIGTFFISSLACAAAILFNLSIGYKGAFILAYVVSRVLSIVYAGTKSLIYPWFMAKYQMEIEFKSEHPSITQQRMRDNDPMDLANLTGFTNPMSMRYKGGLRDW